MADAFCEMKGDTEKDRGNVRYRVKGLVKGTGREGALSELECLRKKKGR